MKNSRFRYDAVERTCTEQKKQVQKYRKALSEDFHGHCGYCNLNDKLIAPLPFQIDHFVPRAEFKGKRDGLETDYRNFYTAVQSVIGLRAEVLKEIFQSRLWITNCIMIREVQR